MARDAPERSRFRSLCAMVDEARERHAEKRARRVKQPWLTLKFAIGLAIAIIGYSCYVYIGRFCVPMIRRDGGALGGRGMGIAFLVVFVLLTFMMIWAYIKVVFTPPGFAKDHSESVDTPNHIASHPPPLSQHDDSHATTSNESTIGIPYEATAKPSTDSTVGTMHAQPPSMHVRPPSAPIPVSEKPTQGSKSERNRAHRSARTKQEKHKSKVKHTHVDDPRMADWERRGLTRNPPSLPVLDPQYRYCRRCNILKPPRAHHCRSCGACVLKFDHHCPWIGQCVGAYNQKFFVVFLFWGCLFCLWTLSTLIGLNAKNDSRPGKSVDPQHIVVIALSGFFTFFTVAMFVTHASLISINQTTVEHLGSRTMKERENDMLADMLPAWKFLAKRRTRRHWDAEWGRIGLEGNLWWQGSIYKHWCEVMGENPLTWLLPIGHSGTDGVNYVRNPRFDAQGRWMPRRTWPAELQ
ncbi:zf-DHHC-domain-containing protein [Dentipellis sp. KUC8613]|nr:zf-DHHC-domain-containing protein [Dentipellis sp. KUC8613]